jgi:nucleoside-diphosphate-sugar epimerase
MNNPKTILITGVAGFFGKYLSQLFLQNGFQVIGYDIRQPSFNHGNFVFINGDLSETVKILNCLKLYRPKHFIHLAGLIKSKSLKMLFEVNVYGLHSVCEAIVLSDLRPHVALISSSAVYDLSYNQIPETHALLPISSYGLTKKIQEDIIVNYTKKGLFTCKIFRPFNLVGYGLPQDLAIASFIEKLQKAKQQGSGFIEVGNLASIRDYVDIRDAADVVFKLFDSIKLDFDVVNICSGVGYKMADILNLCCDILDYKPDIHVHESFNKNNDVAYQVGNSDKLRQYYDISSYHSLRSSLLTMIKI